VEDVLNFVEIANVAHVDDVILQKISKPAFTVRIFHVMNVFRYAKSVNSKYAKGALFHAVSVKNLYAQNAEVNVLYVKNLFV
jgi:hypothetical protein